MNKLFLSNPRPAGRQIAGDRHDRRRILRSAAGCRHLEPFRGSAGAKVNADTDVGEHGRRTTLIGLLPTYETSDRRADVLVACRLVQGIAVGGEWGGAVLMVTEHSPPKPTWLLRKHRADRVSVRNGHRDGIVLRAREPRRLTIYQSGAGAIPFLASAVLVVVGIFIRLRIEETPDFKRNVREGCLLRFPVLETIRRHPKDLMIALGARITEISWIYVIDDFRPELCGHRTRIFRVALVLGAIALGAAVELITIPFVRRTFRPHRAAPDLYLGCLAAICLSFPVFWAIETREPVTVSWLSSSECPSDTGSCTVCRPAFSAKCFLPTCAIAVLPWDTSSPRRLEADWSR